MNQDKLAIVYDWMDSSGGAERVLSVFAEMFPNADWYTLVHNPMNAKWSRGLHINTSFIQKLPWFIRHNRRLTLPLMPFATEAFKLNNYSWVLSITSAFSKAVITRPETKHVSYVLSPPRYLWSHQKEYRTGSFIMKPYVNYLKNWDYIAARRPDELVAISPEVAARIKKYYNLEAEIIMPPFEYGYWSNLIEKPTASEEKKDRPYLLVSRLVDYKRVDLAIDTFKQLPSQRLIIVGDGRQYTALKRRAPSNVEFSQHVSDANLAAHYNSAKALIMPQREDFGYVALEAQACGCPVIAYKKGGVTSTVLENETGLFFESQTTESLLKALDKFNEIEYTIRRSLGKIAESHLSQFSSETFKKKFTKLLS